MGDRARRDPRPLEAHDREHRAAYEARDRELLRVIAGGRGQDRDMAQAEYTSRMRAALDGCSLDYAAAVAPGRGIAKALLRQINA